MMTEKYLVGLLGSDLRLSLAKVIHETEAKELGLDYHYNVFDVEENAEFGDLPVTLAQLRRSGYRGTNITHPFKQSVIPHLDALAPDANQLGAVNAVVFNAGRSTGHNTDWYGFARSVQVHLGDARKQKVVQLGAGGAGVAVAHALLRSGVEELILLGRDPIRTAASAQSLHRIHPHATVRPGRVDELADHIGTADGVVNTTPVGMPAHPGSPVAVELLHPGLWVHDIVYMPLETQLMQDARHVGCLTVGGEYMFVYQAAENVRLFTGFEPNVDRMLAHLHRIVVAGTSESTPNT